MRKGVGLLSLGMYVIGLTALVAIITVFNINILDSTNSYNEIAMINEQYSKFNMYFINSIKKADYLTFSNNVITLYDSADNSLCTYTYRPNNKDILYHDSNLDFSVCKNINTANINIQAVDEIGNNSGKYSKITIGGNPMFSVNNTTIGFSNITYVVGRGY